MKLSTLRLTKVGLSPSSNWLLIEAATSSGVTGLGEATLAGFEASVADELRQAWADLVGRNVCEARVELYSTRPQAPDLARAIAHSAIDQALWDLECQGAGRPLWSYVAPDKPRDQQFVDAQSLTLYANLNRGMSRERSPRAFASIAQLARNEGYGQVKIAPFDGVDPAVGDALESQAYAIGLDRVRAVVEHFHEPHQVMVDCHWRFSLNQSLQVINDLSDLGIGTVEAPTRERDLIHSAQRGSRLTGRGVNIAGGEFALSLPQFEAFAESQAVDILTPDVKFCGGVSTLIDAFALAKSAGLGISPHNPSGPVANLLTAHVLAALDGEDGLPLEFPFGECEWRSDLVGGQEPIAQGRLRLPDGAGIGVALNHTVASEHPPAEVRHNPLAHLLPRALV